MGIKTGIEWCDSTINPIMGCEGCELWSSKRPNNEQHCYAATLVKRYGGKNGWPQSFAEPKFFPGRIEKALKWSDLTGTERPGKPWLNNYPRLVFLNDLSDTFIRDPSPWDWLPSFISQMGDSPHIWLFLTKRSKTMYHFFKEYGEVPNNFWLGTTITSQGTMGRTGDLVRLRRISPNVLLWISAEPLLGWVDLWFWISNPSVAARYGWDLPLLNWIIAGGESGYNARPMHPDWPQMLRDQCQYADIPFFFKQWGKWIDYHNSSTSIKFKIDQGKYLETSLMMDNDDYHKFFYAVGKKDSGRLLDGVEWSQMPKMVG